MGFFPDSLKCTNVRPMYKKEDPFYKKNYRPVGILPLLSKVHERAIYEQVSIILNLFSMKFCVNLEKHIVHALFRLLTSWQNFVR